MSSGILQQRNLVYSWGAVPITFCANIPVAPIFSFLLRTKTAWRVCAVFMAFLRKAAEEKMNKADKKRSEYYNYYSYKTWGAAATYHLCIDSSVLGIDETVRFIEEFIVKKLNL